MAQILDPQTIEAIASLLGDFAETVGVLSSNDRVEGATSRQHRSLSQISGSPAFNVYSILHKLYSAGLLGHLNPVLSRFGSEVGVLPPLALLFVHAKPIIPWSISRYGKASIKLDATGDEIESASYLTKWAAANDINKQESGTGRHITVAERAMRVGKGKETSFNVVRSDVEAWTVQFNGRAFFIRLVRREESAGPSRRDNDSLLDSTDQMFRDLHHRSGVFGHLPNPRAPRPHVSDKPFDAGIDHVLIECYGADVTPIFDLLKHCKQEMLETQKKQSMIRIRDFDIYGCTDEQYVPGRSLDTLDLTQKLRTELVDNALQFFDPKIKHWTGANGSNWRKGYLLYGPPGTGKSSFAAALATQLQLDIYTVSLAGLSEDTLRDFFKMLPDTGCMVLLEDLDAAGLIDDSKDKGKGKETRNDEVDDEDEEDVFTAYSAMASGRPPPRGRRNARASTQPAQTGITVSCLINLLDGVGAKNGRLLIITTNRLGSIDERILRPGRVLRPYHFFGHATKDTAAMTYKRMFGSYPIDPPSGLRLEGLGKAFGDQCPTNFITTAKIQEYCMGYSGRPEAAVVEFAEYLQNKREGRDEPIYDMDDKQMEPVFDGVTDREVITAAVREASEHDGEQGVKSRANSVASVVASAIRRASIALAEGSELMSPMTSAGPSKAEGDSKVQADLLDFVPSPEADVRFGSRIDYGAQMEAVFRRLSIDEASLAVLSPRPMSETSASTAGPIRVISDDDGSYLGLSRWIYYVFS